MGKLRTSLFSRCMGGNSTIIAMAKWPDEFKHIEALVILNVVSGPTFIERGAENLGLDPAEAAKRLHGEKDGQEIFDSLAAQTKELLWIDQSNQRFYAYNHFGQHPERLIGWFDQHMATDRSASHVR